MYSWAESLLDQDAPDLCEPEGPGGPGVTLKQRDAVSGQVLQEQELRRPCLRVQVTLYLQLSISVLNVAGMARSSVTRPCSRACHQLCGECSRWRKINCDIVYINRHGIDSSKSWSSTSREKKVLSPIFHYEIFISSPRHIQKICWNACNLVEIDF